MTAYALNLLDLALTLHALSHGAMELNPLMRSVPVMIGCKVIAVGGLCLLLDLLARRNIKPARQGLHLCTAAYAAVNLYHIYFIFGGAFL